jgi:hypothetical protein
MILIAATAFGFAESRVPSSDRFERGLVTLISLLMWTSVACLLLRLRQPRPPLGRLINQPGTSACLTAAIASGLLHLLALSSPTRFVSHLIGSAFLGGFAVLAVWVVQKFGGDLEPESGWVDRLGVALGFGWVALFGFFCFPFFVSL